MLHLRKVYNQKPCHKNPNPSFGKKNLQVPKKSSILNQTHFSYKHLQKPLENHPQMHLHEGSKTPHGLANCQENLQKIHPSDRVFFLRRFSTIQRVSNQKLISGLEKKTQVYRHINSQTFYFMPFSWEKCQHLDLNETKGKCCICFGTFWVICSFQNSEVQITLNLGSAISRGYNL